MVDGEEPGARKEEKADVGLTGAVGEERWLGTGDRVWGRELAARRSSRPRWRQGRKWNSAGGDEAY